MEEVCRKPACHSRGRQTKVSGGAFFGVLEVSFDSLDEMPALG